jgi:cell wall assembly regulator SMI1
MALHRIADLWERIEMVLRESVPATATTLAPPATDLEIEELESAIDLALPEEFRASLRIHNGQNDPTRCHSFVIEGMLATTEQIAATWRMLTEIDVDLRNQAVGSYVTWWDRNWIPFTVGDGDHLCINLNPRLSATPSLGEIVCHVHDSTYERGIATSYGDWLASVAMKLEGGRFTIDQYGYLRPNIE